MNKFLMVVMSVVIITSVIGINLVLESEKASTMEYKLKLNQKNIEVLENPESNVAENQESNVAESQELHIAESQESDLAQDNDIASKLAAVRKNMAETGSTAQQAKETIANIRSNREDNIAVQESSESNVTENQESDLAQDNDIASKRVAVRKNMAETGSTAQQAKENIANIRSNREENIALQESLESNVMENQESDLAQDNDIASKLAAVRKNMAETGSTAQQAKENIANIRSNREENIALQESLESNVMENQESDLAQDNDIASKLAAVRKNMAETGSTAQQAKENIANVKENVTKIRSNREEILGIEDTPESNTPVRKRNLP